MERDLEIGQSGEPQCSWLWSPTAFILPPFEAAIYLGNFESLKSASSTVSPKRWQSRTTRTWKPSSLALITSLPTYLNNTLEFFLDPLGFQDWLFPGVMEVRCRGWAGMGGFSLVVRSTICGTTLLEFPPSIYFLSCSFSFWNPQP